MYKEEEKRSEEGNGREIWKNAESRVTDEYSVQELGKGE